MTSPLLTVVVPVYNGAHSIARLVDEIKSEFADIQYEIILVNDCSRDNSLDVARSLAATHAQVTCISLRKNFGEHNAVMCGLNYAQGKFAVIVDDDLQNPPSEIRKLLVEAQSKKVDVVFASYAEKKHSLVRNLGSWFNGCVAAYLIDKPRNLYLSSFKLIARPVIDEIIKYKGPSPYIDGLILRVTQNVSSVLVEHRHRAQGVSQYTTTKLIRLYLTMFLNFSILPLRVFTVFGFFILLLGVVFSLVVILEKLQGGDLPSGYTSLLIMVMMLGGVQIVFMGLVGEYLGKMHLFQNGKPQWTIESITRGSVSDA